MPRRPRSVPEPDLFSHQPVLPAPMRPKKLPVATSTDRHKAVSVADIERAVGGWSNDDLEQLRSIATHEAQRRGLLSAEAAHSPSDVDTKAPAEQAGRRHKTAGLVQEIAPGQVSAIRAASEAGMKLSRIAREFGVPLLQIKQILGSS
jgi:LysM repeat protein